MMVGPPHFALSEGLVENCLLLDNILKSDKREEEGMKTTFIVSLKCLAAYRPTTAST